LLPASWRSDEDLEPPVERRLVAGALAGRGDLAAGQRFGDPLVAECGVDGLRDL
jgi:hypothetical protein